MKTTIAGLLAASVVALFLPHVFAQEAPDVEASLKTHREAQDAYARGDLAQAEQLCTRALEQDPANFAAHALRGNVYYDRAEFEKACADFKAYMEGVRPAPAKPVAQYDVQRKLIYLQIFAGRLDEAEEELKTYEGSLGQKARTSLLRGMLSLKQGKEEVAEKYFAEAVRDDAATAKTAHDMAGSFLHVSRFEYALFAYDVAEALDPQNYGAHFGRALAYAGLRRKAEAIASYRKYLEFDSTGDWAAKARAAIAELEKEEEPTIDRPPVVPPLDDGERPPTVVSKSVGAGGGAVQHPSGVVVAVPAKTFSSDTKVTVSVLSRMKPAGTNVKLRSAIVDVSSESVPTELFHQPVILTIPFEGEPSPRLTGAIWDGTTWRPVGGMIDASAKTLAIQTFHFSRFTVVEDRLSFSSLISVRAKDPMRDIPRGSVVMLEVPGVSPPSGRITGRSPGGVLFGETLTEKRFEETGEGKFDNDEYGPRITFLIFVKDEAPLGPRQLIVYEEGEEIMRIPDAFRVVQKLAIVLDIDGLCQNILYGALCSSSPPPNLRRLFGEPQGKAAIGALSAFQFETGLAVEGATTVFPSYTFAGQSALMTGAGPSVNGFPGNEWFDRNPREGEPRRYAWTGGLFNYSVLHWELSDTRSAVGPDGAANKSLRCPTVCDTAGESGYRSVVGWNYFFGRSPKTLRPSAGLVDTAAFGISDTADTVAAAAGVKLHPFVSYFDAEMVKATMQARLDCPDPEQAGILWFYFAGLDHAGHWRGQVQNTHTERLYFIDGLLGMIRAKVSDAVFANALWIVCSDHGQTDVQHLIEPQLRADLLPAWGYQVEGTFTLKRQLGNRTVEEKRGASASDCVVGYNGGCAHVYLRAPNMGSWSDPPTLEAIVTLAMRVANETETGAWKGQIDLILVRKPGENYSVFDMAFHNIVPLSRYLERAEPDCVFFSGRYGWKQSDRAFLTEAIEGMNCDRSGDVVIIPKYPEYYFEAGHTPGTHGSLVWSDMLVPLALARPCLEKLDSLKALIGESIDLKKKPRPGNRDVPALIMNFLRQTTSVDSGTSQVT
ncbi:MAG: alkaline phosphatase family protein, partial [Planctomycetota bacterium]|nr:alkaline phosphatase family protein [Planctomycetota bacterium]